MAYEKTLWDIAFGRDAISGFPGCLQGAGFDDIRYAATKNYLISLVEKARRGESIPPQDIPALCNIILVLSRSFYKQDRTQDDVKASEAMWEFLRIVEELVDKPVKAFRNEYAFLSNSYECDVEYNGIRYRNVEAAFQAQKCEDADEMKRFSSMSTKEARNAGKKVKPRKDWEKVKYDIMEDIVWGKFTQNPELAEMLIATGSRELVAGNTRGDTTWGVDISTGKGRNWLGTILMNVRDDLE